MTQQVQKIKVQILAAFKELFNPFWRFIVYYGGRGSGKSESVGRALLIRGRKQRIRVLCTREIQNTIKDSVHKLLRDIIELYGFTDYVVTNDSIVNQITGTEFIFRGLRSNPTEIKSMQGIDVCWVEEAQSVTTVSLDILTPTIRKPGSQIIFTFNRQNELDPVYVKFVKNSPPRTFVKKVNYDVLVKAGLFPQELQEEMENDKEKDYDLYAHKWLGEPQNQNDAAIISRSSVLKAMERTVEDDGAEIVGADIARLGGDRIVFWKRKGLKTVDTLVMSKQRIPATCDALEKFVNFDTTIEIRVDDTGVGGGVTDEMMKRGYNIVPVNFGGEPGDKNKYPNWISEAWFHMADIIEEAELPENDDLISELTNRNWKQDNKGKRQVESKKDYKDRTKLPSPDLADACIICYSNPAAPSILDYYAQQVAVNVSSQVSQAIVEANREA